MSDAWQGAAGLSGKRPGWLCRPGLSGQGRYSTTRRGETHRDRDTGHHAEQRLTQNDLRSFCAGHQIAVEAWSPLGQGNVLDDPEITVIARRAAKTPAQVVLRWHLQRGDIVFPKSVTPDRIRENIDVFDFGLSASEVEAISALNRNARTGPDPDTFDMI